MSNLFWMPLHIPDYLADTSHLSTEEHGAYLLLIMHYWQQNGLPDDDTRLARIARLPLDQWAKVRPAIRPFFGSGWFHKRVEAERVKAETKFQNLSAAGKKGGRPRKEEKGGMKPSESEAFSTVKAFEKPLESNYNHNHIQNNNPIQDGKTSTGNKSDTLPVGLGREAFGGVA